MNPSSKILAVLFPLDGILIDSKPLVHSAAVAMFGERGLSVRPEDFPLFVSAGEDLHLGAVAQKYNFPLDIASARNRTDEIYLELARSRLEPFPGAVELVRECKSAGLKVAVVSGADRIR